MKRAEKERGEKVEKNEDNGGMGKREKWLRKRERERERERWGGKKIVERKKEWKKREGEGEREGGGRK